VLYSDEFYENCIAALSERRHPLRADRRAALFPARKKEEYTQFDGLPPEKRVVIAYKPVFFTCPMIVGGF
jgi:hypothetical protein